MISLFLLSVSFVGFLCIFKHLICLVRWLFVSLVRTPKHLKISYGSWAVVTGSTDGIGKAFAFRLAGQGLNLVLVTRDPRKLEAVRLEIEGEFPDVSVKMVAVDFAGSSPMGCRVMREAVEEAIKGLDMGVLVNNVGISYPSAAYFHELEEEVWRKIVRVNVEGTSWVTRAVLPGMVNRRRGVVNIGSAAGLAVPSHPLYAIYAATKS
ncbi:hypothetical protein Dimus_015194 [Dionaea muscipula]